MPSLVIEQLWDTPKAALLLLLQKATHKHIVLIAGKKEDRFLESFPFFNAPVEDFPPRETLLEEGMPESLDISGKRLALLHTLIHATHPRILHVPVESLCQAVPSKKALSSHSLVVKKGEKIFFDALLLQLEHLGYQRNQVASEKGEFAVRGGIIDLFPAAALSPIRLDFFGEELEEIRSYDPITQRSTGTLAEAFICLTQEKTLLQKDKRPSTLFDYLGKQTLVIWDDLLAVEDAYVTCQKNHTTIFASLDEMLRPANTLPHIFFIEHSLDSLSDVHRPHKKGRAFYQGKDSFQPLTFTIASSQIESVHWNHPFEEVSMVLQQSDNKASFLLEEILGELPRHPLLHSHFIVTGQAEQKLIEKQLPPLRHPPLFHQGYLPSGFLLPDIHLACIALPELTNRHKMRRQNWRSASLTTSSSFHELTPGDFVVHAHSGIGQFLGITQQTSSTGEEAEYLQISYAKESTLYVPVSQSHLVSRYIGVTEDKPTLSVLGSTKWKKSCQEAQTSVLGYAKELLERAAAREAYAGFAYPPDSEEMHLFEAEFPFTETQDQLQAIAAIKSDLCSSRPMDRLLCGDVGYGKTEVAMRAAFKAVVDGQKQVAMLVPTTVLAQQHYETFSARMASFPLRIAVLSRFTSPKKAKEILQQLQAGTIDILIGTHRLLSKDVIFPNLGLLIIDEEQRFGVRAKEALKAKKIGIDCLTLSATPIPRTLYLSLVGARELSTIHTPPQDRLPIKTMVIEKDLQIVKNAMIREFARDGQVLFVHNRVETLPLIQSELQKLVPEAKIVMAHGQMATEEVDTIFWGFKSGQTDLLLATTIVESGIDIPNANTIFIDRADTFGMADLYQLRGRVGRWNRPAYAYFLLPKNTSLPEITKKRLQTLVETSGFGGGMKLALRDLEIRGAGDILGVQQSGQIASVGFHFYCRLLKKAVNALKKGSAVEFNETKLDCPSSAHIPPSYIKEASLRMEIYHKLGSCTTKSEVEETRQELADRFGPLPKEVELLLCFTHIRIHATSLHITAIKFEKFTFTVERTLGKSTTKTSFPLGSFQDPMLFAEKVCQILDRLH